MTASRPSSPNSDIDGGAALEQALALHSMPGNAGLLRERPLPGSALVLIRIAAGDGDALASATTRTGELPGHVVEAVVLYIQQVFFHDGADSYRTLGVNPDASTATIKEHYRWLMRWLHPDRNPGRSEAAYSERVNSAWKSLSTEQRRREYDARLGALVRQQRDGIPANVSPSRRFAPEPPPQRFVLSPRATRLLPTIIFGILTASACIVLVASYRSRLAELAGVAPATAALDAALPSSEDDSAQKAAIRDRIAFEEHAAELGQAADDLAASVSASPPPTRPTDVAAFDPRVSSGGTTGGLNANEATLALSHDFTAAYARGDVGQLLRLFASNAVGNRGGIDSIAEDYGSLFANTTTRELDLDGLKWTVSPDRIAGSGEFIARIHNRGEAFSRHVKGWIQIEAVPIDGQWKIQRIAHGNDP